jgi:hypothetical protein
VGVPRTVGQEVSLNEGDGGQPIPNRQSNPLGDAEETSYHLEAGMISHLGLFTIEQLIVMSCLSFSFFNFVR